MSIPKLKQTFEIYYEYLNNNEVVKCYIKPKLAIPFLSALKWLGNSYTSDIDAIFGGETNKTWEGVATLKAGDVKDVHMAEEIARKKAMRKYFKDLKRIYSLVWESVINIANEKLEFIEQAEAKASDLSLEIVKINKGENV